MAVNGVATGRWRRTQKRGIVHIGLSWSEPCNEILHAIERSIYVADFIGCGIEVDSKSTAKYGPAVSAQVIGETYTRAETQFRIPTRAAVEERSHSLERLFEPGVHKPAFKLITQAKIQGEPSAHLPVVL